MQRLAIVVLMLLVVAAPAGAQTDLGRLKLALGDRVDVTDRSGAITIGVLTDVSDTTVIAGNREFPIDSIVKVDRRGDSIWSGFMIGAGFGLLLSPIAQEGCRHGSNVPCVVG